MFLLWKILIQKKFYKEILYRMFFLFLDYQYLVSGTKSSTLLGLWNNEYFVFPTFRESLFAINQ